MDQILDVYAGATHCEDYRVAYQVLRRIATSISLSDKERFILDQWKANKGKYEKDKLLRDAQTDQWFKDPRMQRMLSVIEDNYDKYDVRSTVMICKRLKFKIKAL